MSIRFFHSSTNPGEKNRKVSQERFKRAISKERKDFSPIQPREREGEGEGEGERETERERTPLIARPSRSPIHLLPLLLLQPKRERRLISYAAVGKNQTNFFHLWRSRKINFGQIFLRGSKKKIRFFFHSVGLSFCVRYRLRNISGQGTLCSQLEVSIINRISIAL